MIFSNICENDILFYAIYRIELYQEIFNLFIDSVGSSVSGFYDFIMSGN